MCLQLLSSQQLDFIVDVCMYQVGVATFIFIFFLYFVCNLLYDSSSNTDDDGYRVTDVVQSGRQLCSSPSSESTGGGGATETSGTAPTCSVGGPVNTNWTVTAPTRSVGGHVNTNEALL